VVVTDGIGQTPRSFEHYLVLFKLQEAKLSLG